MILSDLKSIKKLLDMKSSLTLLLVLPSFFLLAQTTTINYTTSTDDFVNPERGFYRYSETRASNYSFLNSATLAAYRNLHTPSTANYQIYSSLVFRYFILDDFVSSAITQTFLDNMQADFNAARAAGVKLIPRFAYITTVDNSCGNWICPPYGDAAKTWVLSHITQLTPVLQANSDVIATVQMGFIGVWGENYYTDYFGDASLSPFKLTDANWQDRIDVLNALLAAVPTDRMVEARYPQMKQRTVHGISATTASAAITSGQAHNGSTIARIGHHNDCLFASADDFGTYADYGNDATSAQSDTTNLKPYKDLDSEYTVVGGETCNEYNPYNNCAASDPNAYADTELKRMHYSYLNSQYNNDVNNDWVGTCMEDIKKNLGYRFALQSGTYSNEAQQGQVITMNTSIKNVGFAAPYNPRGVELVFVNSSNSDTWYAQLTDDPRFWLQSINNYTINHTLCIPAGMPNGTYNLYLNLPDPESSIYDRSEYAIRLANKLSGGADVWNSSTGYNDLGHSITINNTASNAACNGEITFTSNSSFLPIELISFRAIPQSKSIILEWTTAQELNNAGYNIQRSLDAKTFETIGWIDGLENSNQNVAYDYEDENVLPKQIYYYRLQQVDLDGSKNNSYIKSAFLKGENHFDAQNISNAIHLFPNPAQDEIQIQVNLQNQSPIFFTVYDVIGRQIDLVKKEAATEFIYNCSELKSGIYFIEFEIEQNRGIKKIIIE